MLEKGKQDLQNFIDNQKDSIKLRVRKQAIKNTKKTLSLHEKSIKSLSDEEYETLLADEENKIWQKYKTNTIAGLAALIGISWF